MKRRPPPRGLALDALLEHRRTERERLRAVEQAKTARAIKTGCATAQELDRALGPSRYGRT